MTILCNYCFFMIFYKKNLYLLFNINQNLRLGNFISLTFLSQISSVLQTIIIISVAILKNTSLYIYTKIKKIFINHVYLYIYGYNCFILLISEMYCVTLLFCKYYMV